jgi:uncharacterized membrane protein YhaH (DUF805 family)
VKNDTMRAQMKPSAHTTAASSAAAGPNRAASPRRSQPNTRAAAALWGMGLQGRLGRLDWITALAVLAAVAAIAQVASLHHPHPGWLHAWRFGAGVALLLVLRASALRFHDRGRSGWWSLALLLPGLNLVALIELLLLPGDDAANDFGNVPPPGSVGEFAFACCVSAVFAGLGVLSLHPEHAIEDLRPAADRAALAPYGSHAAKAAFETRYRPAPHPKAYAGSTHGAFGWSAGADSVPDALLQAVAQCESRRRTFEPACVPLDINDQDTRAGQAAPAAGPKPAR